MQSVRFLTVVFIVHLIHVANVDGDNGRRKSPESETGIRAHGHTGTALTGTLRQACFRSVAPVFPLQSMSGTDHHPIQSMQGTPLFQVTPTCGLQTGLPRYLYVSDESNEAGSSQRWSGKHSKAE